MRRLAAAAGLLVLAACSTITSQNGFEVQPGEIRNFSFKGQPVSKVRVDVQVGRVEVVIKAWEKGVLKEMHRTSWSEKNSIEEVEIRGVTPARGSLIVYQDD